MQPIIMPDWFSVSLLTQKRNVSLSPASLRQFSLHHADIIRQHAVNANVHVRPGLLGAIRPEEIADQPVGARLVNHRLRGEILAELHLLAAVFQRVLNKRGLYAFRRFRTHGR